VRGFRRGAEGGRGLEKLMSFSSPFSLADPAFEIVEPRDMTLDDYQNSQALDYDDVSQ
jgi:hypothetical protein